MYRVAIIGRPNVGKSTLFNRLTGTRKAIVGNEPGMTRDRLSGIAHWDGKQFEVIDTGGLLLDKKSEVIPEKVLQQAEVAMREADLLLFVVDVRSGIIALDETLNVFLRERGKEYLLVVNKVDVPHLETEALQFFAFGVQELYPVSAEHKQGVTRLIETIGQRISQADETIERREVRVAIIGRPNVGKSSLLNRLLGEERAIVTDFPGTTRDAIDSQLEFEDQVYRLIDTAGIRRKGRADTEAEKLSVIMARNSLRRADVALLVIDVVEGATKLDATIGGYADEAGKSVIVVANKWDLLSKDEHRAAWLEKEVRSHMRFLQYAPVIFVSAKTGQRVIRILDLVQQAYEARYKRVPTANLNDFMAKEILPMVAPPAGSRRFPIKYATQARVAPPTFVLFTRSPRKLHFSTTRFLINRLRRNYGFYATPIRIMERAPAKNAKKKKSM